MNITFAGVGEAFDEHRANTSLFVQSSTTSLLMDCGFTAATAFWAASSQPQDVDALYITHFHGDHYFGIPALIIRLREAGRTKPLTIIGQPGVRERVLKIMELAYPNTLAKADFTLAFMECTPEDTPTIGDLQLSFAMNDHPMPCQSIRVDCATASMFYSSDGRPTAETRALAHGCNLVVHESFSLEPDTPGHGTVDSSIAFAQEAEADILALVHIKRMVRQAQRETIVQRIENVQNCRILIPEPGDTLYL